MLIAAGCLSQRYGDTLAQEAPGLVIGTRRWMDIFEQATGAQASRRGDADVVGRDERGTCSASAYLMAAGDPALSAPSRGKGPVNRPLESIEAVRQEIGVREVMLIAQDSSDYAG